MIKLFKREEPVEDAEEFIEIKPEVVEEAKKVNIRIETLNDYRDVEKIQKLLREGNVVFLKIRNIKERDLGELKRSVERLKRTILAMNGDIVGVEEDFLILTPAFAKIFRGMEEEAKVEVA